MPSPTREDTPVTLAAAAAPRTPVTSYGALAWAAGTLIQVGTRTTPFVSTLDIATQIDVGRRPL